MFPTSSTLIIDFYVVAFSFLLVAACSQPVITITNLAGQPLHEVVLYKNKDTFPGVIKCSEDSTWKFRPYPPSGLLASGYDKMFYISGTPSDDFPRTEFTITATSTKGTTNATIFISVISCNDGFFFYFEGRHWLNLSYANNVVNKACTGWMCLQRVVYDFSVEPGYRYVMTDENKTFYLLLTEDNQLTSGQIDVGYHSPPILYAPTVIKNNFPYSLTAGFSFINPVTNFTLFPPQPYFKINNKIVMDQNTFYEGYHILTATNEYGSSSQEILFQLNTCDTASYLSLTGIDMGYEIVDSKNNTPKAIFKYYCSNDTSFTIHLHPNQSPSQTLRPLYVFDRNGVVADYSTISGSNFFNFSFNWVVSSFSTYLTSSVADDNWYQVDFAETNWKEDRGSIWRQFSGDVAYFRKHFSVDSITDYPTLFIDVIGSGEIDVYLNGEFVSHIYNISSSSTYTRLDVSTQILNIGDNVLAVSVEKSESSIVVFDAMIEMVSIAQRIQSLSGIVTEYQDTPSGNPDYAFNQWEQHSWKIDSLPASLEFQFNDTEKRIVNRAFFQTPNYLLTKIRIEGVDDDQSSVLYESTDDFLNKYLDYRVVDFDNSKAYSMYRIVFLSATNVSINIENIRLYRDMLPYCPNTKNLVSSRAGDTVFTNCGFFYSGLKQTHCIFDGTQSTWVEDSSSCLSRLPDRGYAFVDFTIRLTHAMEAMFDSMIRDKLNELFVETTAARPEEIRFIYVRNSTWDDYESIDVYVRISVKRTGGDYIAEQLRELADSLNEAVEEYIGGGIQGMFVGRIHVYLSWKPEVLLVIIIGALIAFILCGFSFYGIATFISLRKQRTKNLKHTLPQKEALLSSVEYCVCSQIF